MNRRPVDKNERNMKTYYVPRPAVISRVKQMTETEKCFTVSLSDGALNFVPGQFVQLSTFGYGEAPFSICSSPLSSDGFDVCIRAVGNVSKAVHRMHPGDGLGIRGPYGQGFPTAKLKNRDLLCIAGGIGIAPLRSLITYAIGNREDFGRLIVIYGAKAPSVLLFREDLVQWESDSRIELYQIVDQPDETWQGPTGVVTDCLKELRINPKRTVATVVGPPVIFRFVAMELLGKGVSGDQIYFSLERRFQCGVGKCGHCQLNDLYVCQDGPVLTYSTLVGRTEAVEAWAPEEEQDR